MTWLAMLQYAMDCEYKANSAMSLQKRSEAYIYHGRGLPRRGPRLRPGIPRISVPSSSTNPRQPAHKTRRKMSDLRMTSKREDKEFDPHLRDVHGRMP